MVPTIAMNQNQTFSPAFAKPARGWALPTIPPPCTNQVMSSRFGMLRPIQKMIIRATPPPNQGPSTSCSIREVPAHAAKPSGPSKGISTTLPKRRLNPVMLSITKRVAVYQCRPRSQGFQRSSRRPLRPPSSGTLPRKAKNTKIAKSTTRRMPPPQSASRPFRSWRQFCPPLSTRKRVSMFFQSLEPAASGIFLPVTAEYPSSPVRTARQ